MWCRYIGGVGVREVVLIPHQGPWYSRALSPTVRLYCDSFTRLEQVGSIVSRGYISYIVGIGYIDGVGCIVGVGIFGSIDGH